MKVSKLALVGILSTSILAGGAQISYAAGNTISTTTTGEVTFTEDTNTIKPLDPLDPSVTVQPSIENGTTGPLSINYVSQFKFGNQSMTSKDKTYNAALDNLSPTSGGASFSRPNFVQVTDNRGTNAGWKLQVQQLAQFSTKVNNENVELNGAVITIKNSNVVTTNDNQATAPTIPMDKEGIKLNPQQTTDVMTAKKDAGMSTWINVFGTKDTGDKSVTLFVPGISSKVQDSNYKTELKWLLVDSPD